MYKVWHVQSLENEGEHFLLSNTHLFSQLTHGDFIRFLQCVISARYLENLKKQLLYEANDEWQIKNVRILIGGDFNFASSTSMFKYLTSKSIVLNGFSQGLILDLFGGN
jgi:mRNA deadenylase 3'-5' endonuclease subunit Ccr4